MDMLDGVREVRVLCGDLLREKPKGEGRFI